MDKNHSHPNEWISSFETVQVPPSEDSVNKCRSIKSFLEMRAIQPNRVLALEEGGIMMDFRHNGAAITIEVDNEGNAAYVWEKEGRTEIKDMPAADYYEKLMKAFGSHQPRRLFS
jgi:hypothetical protein